MSRRMAFSTYTMWNHSATGSVKHWLFRCATTIVSIGSKTFRVWGSSVALGFGMHLSGIKGIRPATYGCWPYSRLSQSRTAVVTVWCSNPKILPLRHPITCAMGLAAAVPAHCHQGTIFGSQLRRTYQEARTFAHRAAILRTFSKQAAERCRGAIILGNIGRGNPAVIPFLIRLLPDREPLPGGHEDADVDFYLVRDQGACQAAKDALLWIGGNSVPFLVETLKSSHAPIETRERAAGLLGSFGDGHASLALIDAAQCKEKVLQEMALSSLSKLGDRRSTACVLAIAQDAVQGKRAREYALWTLGAIGDSSFIPTVKKIACDRDVDRDTREAAIYALGRIGDPATLPVLLRLLESPEFEIQTGVIVALGGFSSKTATERLVGLLEGSNSMGIQFYAATALARSKDPNAMKRLLQFLRYDNDLNRSLRYEITDFIAAFDNQESLAFIFDGLRQQKYEICQASIHALTSVRSPRAVPMLVSVIRNPRWFGNENVRFNTFFALTHICSTESANAVAKLACDPGLPLVSRLRAIRVLGRLRVDQILPQLASLAADRDVSIRSGVATAVGDLAHRAVPRC